MERPTKTSYYLNIAKAVSTRSTCLRRQYGAVIVKDDRIIATGYNGAPRGVTNCCDINTCYREQNHIPHGERYEECCAVHAELNALLSAGPLAKDSTLYLWGGENGVPIKAAPCKLCLQNLKNAEVCEVIATNDGWEYEY